MTTSSWRLTLAAAIVVLGATAGGQTQTPRPMGIVDLLDIPRLSDPTSRDNRNLGVQIAFQVANPIPVH